MLLDFLRNTYLPQTMQVMGEPQQPTETHRIYGYEQVYALVDAELLNGLLSQGWQKLSAEGASQRLKMFGNYPEQDRLSSLAEKIALTGAPAYLDVLPRKGLVRLIWQNQQRLELHYRIPIEIGKTRPKIALIMDDMGGSLNTFHQLLDFAITVTPSILPENRNATEGALLQQQAGREYMIHIPMQPKSYPKTDPGPNSLLLGQTELQTRQLVRHFMERVPGAAGSNNHMGSRYTLERESMHIVLEDLKKSGQFYIDSKTTSGSVAYDEARKMGLPTVASSLIMKRMSATSASRFIKWSAWQMIREKLSQSAIPTHKRWKRCIWNCLGCSSNRSIFCRHLPWFISISNSPRLEIILSRNSRQIGKAGPDCQLSFDVPNAVGSEINLPDYQRLVLPRG